MIHCSRISVFNCPQHKLIIYVNGFFFKLPKQGVGKKKREKKGKFFHNFQLFRFRLLCYFMLAKLTP